MIKAEDWKWYGQPGHFICGRWCRFHLATEIGEYFISTVGEYVHPRHSGASEADEMEWLKENWPGEDIGWDRKYETMVFKIIGRCETPECGCGMPEVGGENIDMRGCNSAKEAREDHMALCSIWANK